MPRPPPPPPTGLYDEFRKRLAEGSTVDQVKKVGNEIKAVKKAGTTDVDAVKDAIIGVTVPNLTGGYAAMMPNHHITKPVLIGEIQDNGQFSVVWETSGLVAGDAWSDYLPGSRDMIADWRKPLFCGTFNTATGTCGASAGEMAAEAE